MKRFPVVELHAWRRVCRILLGNCTAIYSRFERFIAYLDSLVLYTRMICEVLTANCGSSRSAQLLADTTAIYFDIAAKSCGIFFCDHISSSKSMFGVIIKDACEGS